MTPPRFALIGAAGFVAPRHLEAIKHVGGKLVAALDPHDAVGVLDRYDHDTEFFTEPERFERHLEMLKREGAGVDWVSICSPNYLHDSHIRMGLRARAKVICEKPLVLEPKNLDALAEIEQECNQRENVGVDTRRIFTVLQLRHMPQLVNLYNADVALKKYLGSRSTSKRAHVGVYYTAPRGRWYHRSWKGSEEKSGGVITNIGIHLLDALMWIWGTTPDDRGCWVQVSRRTSTQVHGLISLKRADVTFELSVDGDRPARRLMVDDYEIDFTTGFEGLHNKVYADTLAGDGHGIEDARPAVELAARLRNCPMG